jgi:ribosome-binding protein aMBF1 (putative translation factor)
MTAKKQPARPAPRGPGAERKPRPNTPLAAIGANVERVRKARGLSSQQLAELAGVGLTSVIELEAARREIRILGFRAIARALGVSMDELCDLG